MRILILVTLAVLASAAPFSQAAPPRDYVVITGSSTAYPFATVVAERVGKTTGFRTPQVNAFGSGGGIRQFCGGIGPRYPDIVLASRRMRPTEVTDCHQNRVLELVELKFGYDGIIIAAADKVGPKLSLTPRDIYQAIARDVPDPDGGQTLVRNPHRTWKQINPALPDVPVKVYGPPPTSGTRDVLAELGMERGCLSFPLLSTMRGEDPARFRAACHAVREDGAYIDSGENDNIIIKKILADPAAVGIFGFNFYDQNLDRVRAAQVNGVAPTWETIFDQVYPLSRPLYLYVKSAHLGWIPGLEAFLKELINEGTWGENGYLSERGLVPLTRDERDEYAEKVRQLW